MFMKYLFFFLDNFDVPGSGSTKNLYQNYSNVGGRGHSFSHSVTTEDGRIYTFIGLDACPEQGLRRPFNFVGLLRENEISFLKSIVSSNSKTDYFIWFGHYPTSCILSHQDQVNYYYYFFIFVYSWDAWKNHS